MITITNMTTNGNFEWNNEAIKANGSFSKGGDASGNLISIYCNFAGVNGEYQGDNANIYFNNGVPSYNINSSNPMLMVQFINNVNSLISELNGNVNEIEDETE